MTSFFPRLFATRPLHAHLQRDQTIRLWSLARSTCLQTLRGHSGSVLCLQYSEGQLISGSSDSRILVWHLNEQGKYEVSKSLVGHGMGVLDLAVGGRWIVSCSKVSLSWVDTDLS